MFNRIYIETAAKDEPLTKDICGKFDNADIIDCHKYTDVFNRKAQHFRLQKISPGLILARKHQNFVLPAPKEYGLGGDLNYYFSHMLNCIYDCRYCFLQGMYRSANYVLFTNYDDFYKEIEAVCSENKDKSCHFFSGYDCDSLAMEPLTGFMGYLLPKISGIPNLLLELRTKSTQVRQLLSITPQDNCVVAFSLLPQPLSNVLDAKAPDIYKRLNAARKLQNHGWKIGLRFDPLIYDSDMESIYSHFFFEIAERLDISKIHSVTLGSFRLPAAYFNILSAYYPDDKLMMAPMANKNRIVSYNDELRQKTLEFCYQQSLSYFAPDIIHTCEPLI